MDKSCLKYLITDEQRRQFEEEGYLIVRDALTPEQVERLTEAVGRVWEAEVPTTPEEFESLQQKGLVDRGITDKNFSAPFVGKDQSFIDLLDHPKTFPIVSGILGWNIYLYHSHMSVKRQEAPESEPVKFPLGFHQDSGRVNRDMESHPRPRLSLKVAYYLSDTSEPGRGNFWIVPGSHLKDTLEIPPDRNPDAAMPVLVKPGDAVFFDRRLWHAGSPNHSPITRKALFYGYGYRWIRTKDDMRIRPGLYEKCDPIRKQLLGAGTDANGYYSPRDEDVPLKVWLEEHMEEVRV